MSKLKCDLSGRKALVTGGSRGIGRAIVMALAHSGAEVCVNYRADSQAAEATVAEVVRSGGRAWAAQTDVSIGSDVERLFKILDERFEHRLDILVNNAGGLQRSTLDSTIG